MEDCLIIENIDYSMERHFVQTFIRKARRERLLLQLTTPKRRYEALDRFCHQADDLIDHSKILMEGEDLERRPEFREFVKKHDEPCLVLSPEFWMDEQFLFLKDAVEQAVISLDAVLVIGSTFALVYGEPVKGGREKYLLSEQDGVF
ncbi:MAG: hypothetical protein IJT40_02845 [Firmicutes bacterium]|nr:hypothetical protein [Bacillota bacterium]